MRKVPAGQIVVMRRSTAGQIVVMRRVPAGQIAGMRRFRDEETVLIRKRICGRIVVSFCRSSFSFWVGLQTRAVEGKFVPHASR